jgi:alpha-D-ribose 1-methylphosphonate 5-triphosphate synthase subunit PhnG
MTAQDRWDRPRLSRLCALGDATRLERLATEVGAGHPVVTVQEPTTELVLMESADPVSGGSFYVGDVLLTTALVEIDGAVGCGVVMGDEPARAQAAAVLDATLNAGGATPGLLDALAAEERRLAASQRAEWALAARTRVQFETMEDRDPGAARP